MFINVPQDPQIDEKIREKEKEIDFVRQLSKPGSINIITINIEHLRSILEQGFKSTHENAERQLMAHIENHWKDKGHPKTFIRDGLALIHNPSDLNKSACPFCGQSLAPAKALLECYRQYFDEAYKKFREALIQEIEIFNKINPEVMISAAEVIISSWQQFLGEDYSKKIIASLANLKIEIVKAKGMFKVECDQKIQDLNHSVEFSQLDIFTKNFSELQDLVTSFNKDVQLYISSHSGKSEETLKQEIGKLRAIKSRYIAKWVKYCQEYSDTEINIRRAKTERDQKIEALSVYTQETFNKHQVTINTFLNDMGVDFKIANFCEHKDLRRTPGIFCGYEIEFFSRDRIPLHDLEDKPSAKNCLSQGDKGALAFAFFLSTLFHDDALGDKIVIFDDPVSSFDGERKRKTAHLLLDVISLTGSHPEQLIIMTHETQFLRILYNASNNADIRYIKIEPDGVTPQGRKKSTISHCNVMEEFLQAEQVSQLKKIQKCLQDNATIPEDVRADCRKVIEAVFKIKYYLELEEEINQKKSVRAFLDKLCDLNLPSYDTHKKNRLYRLFNDLHVPHHSDITQTPAEASTGDLKSILRDTLKELREL
jgi:wobble nucleotide-excising tRNase